MASEAAQASAIGEARTYGEVVRIHARERPGDPAFTFGDEALTFAELDRGSNRAANGLKALGVRKGDRIAYLGKNHPLYFEVLMGAAKIGAVMTPVNWRLAGPEVEYILDNSCARVVFAGEGFVDQARQAAEGIARIEAVIGLDALGAPIDYRSWRDDYPDSDPQDEVGAEDDALQLYTSGTTGKPKGAVMTHGSLLSSRSTAQATAALREWQESVPGEVTLLAMPCFHISGTGTGLGTIAAGTNSIVLPEYDPTKALDLIESYNISKIFLVPAAIQILLNHPRVGEADFSRLKYITYGASPIPLELMKAAMDQIGCGFVQMYGMTETSGTIVALDPSDHVPEGSPKMRSVGTPLQGVEIKIIDENGEAVPANTVGEIATRSPKNMKGYWN
ncbi:MAG: AMP-binding protein, partial [Tsuneonella sp.]